MSMPRPHLRLALCLLALCLPASAAAQTPQAGGLAFGDPALSASPALVGQPMSFSGTLGGAARGSRIDILLRARGTKDWHTVTTVTADEDGAFQATWVSAVPGRFVARAVPAGAAAAASVSAPVTTVVTVFRSATATWYDMPGKVGACGVRITPATLGVAHKSLPCGSRVDVTYEGRTINVPVIDRGPYARGVSYDLTLAAADALGVTAAGRVKVGVLPAGERTPAAPLLAAVFGGLPAAAG